MSAVSAAIAMWMILITFILGALVGILVNQLASALPARRPPTLPHCTHCGRTLPWWQWLTLIPHLIGRARCPSCGAALGRRPLRHPLVEIGLGSMYSYLWILFGPSIKWPLYAIYSTIFALILVTDIERRLIFNAVTYPSIIFAIIASFFTPNMTWWSSLLGGAIGLIFFFIVALVGNAFFGDGAMGMGDVKLATFVGLITGFPLVIEALVLSILCGSAVSLVLLIAGARGLRDHIPYGPFLVAGAMTTLLWGYPIAVWFLY